MPPDDRSVEAASRCRLDAPPRELWAALDGPPQRRRAPAWLGPLLLVVAAALIAWTRLR